MSRTKNDQTFPWTDCLKTDESFAALIASTLRSEYGLMHSGLKHLARDVGVSPRTARNWYEGKNLISSRHLVLLGQRSDAIQNLLASFLFPPGGSRAREGIIEANTRKETVGRGAREAAENVQINVQIKSADAALNARQLWFLDELCRNVNLAAQDLARAWKVDYKTAHRDIAGLKECGLLVRDGSRKSGRYVQADGLKNYEDS